MTCVLSWKVRPNWAVLMASRRGLFDVEPMFTLGFWVTGERFMLCVCVCVRERVEVYVLCTFGVSSLAVYLELSTGYSATTVAPYTTTCTKESEFDSQVIVVRGVCCPWVIVIC